MGRGWHTAQRERGGGYPFLDIGRSYDCNLVCRDRKAPKFEGWKFCSHCTRSVQHYGGEGCDREQILHGVSPFG
jgi:hypothetical protein